MMSVRKEMFIASPHEELWKLHGNIAAWNQWHQGISSAKLEGPLAVGPSFQWEVGNIKLNSTIHILEEPRQFGWEGRVLGMQTVFLWDFEPQGDGTAAVVEVRMESRLLNLLFRRILVRSFEKMMEFWLKSLKARAEGKEPPCLDDM